MFSGVTRWRPAPLAFTTNSAVLPLDGLNAANAARDPSGDQSAPTRSKNPRSMTDQRGGLNLVLPVPLLRAEKSTPCPWGSNLAYKTPPVRRPDRVQTRLRRVLHSLAMAQQPPSSR